MYLFSIQAEMVYLSPIQAENITHRDLTPD